MDKISDFFFETLEQFQNQATLNSDELEILKIFSEYVDLLYDDEEEEISIYDISSYELDDFLNFHLKENFTDFFKNKKGKYFLQKYYKWLFKKNDLPTEFIPEIEEVLGKLR